MARLERIVDELASRYEAPWFMPHVSLHVDRVVEQADLPAVVDETAARFAPFAMRAGPTDHSPAIFKTLFVTMSGGDIFELAAALETGVARWRPAPTEAAEPLRVFRLEPHLSLLYKELPDHERAKLADRYCYDGESFRFDRIATVTPGPGARDFSRVDDWLVSPARVLVGVGRQPCTG